MSSRIGRAGDIDTVLAYLRGCRSLEPKAKEAAKSFVAELGSYDDYNRERGVHLSIQDAHRFTVYFQGMSESRGSYTAKYDERTGVMSVDYAPQEKSRAFSEFIGAWETHRTSLRSDDIIAKMMSGLDKVVAFKEGKAYEISMREVEGSDVEGIVRRHVDERTRALQSSYEETLNSYNRNLASERYRHESEIERWKTQSLGDLAIDWKDSMKGRFFIWKDSHGSMGIGARVKPVLTTVFVDGDERVSYTLDTPKLLGECLAVKMRDGSWDVYNLDGTYFEHPHVQSDTGNLCLGNMGHLGTPLKSSMQVIEQAREIEKLLGSINWNSPYNRTFSGNTPNGRVYLNMKEFDTKMGETFDESEPEDDQESDQESLREDILNDYGMHLTERPHSIQLT